MAGPVNPYSPEQGQVAIRDKDGSVWKIPEAQLGKAQAEGAVPATEAEFRSAQIGTTAGQVGSAVIGAARGVTFGYSDPLYVEGARALGGDESAEHVRHTLNLAREMHPDATTGGEIGGMVAPMFFGGGAATAAKGGVGARMLAAAPRAFAEGAVIGGGQQASEDALGNHKFVAEKYASSMGKMGAVGLILGTGLHGAGAALGKKGAEATFGAGLAPNSITKAETEALGIERAATHRVEDAVEKAFPTPTEVPMGGEQLSFPMGGGGGHQPELPFRAPELPLYARREMGISPEVLDAGLRDVPEAGTPFFANKPMVNGADHETLQRRVEYGGKKGAAAARRLEEFPREIVSARLEEPASRVDGTRFYPATAEAPFEQRFGIPRGRLGEESGIFSRGELFPQGELRGQGELNLGAPARAPIPGKLGELPLFERPAAPWTPKSFADEVAAGGKMDSPEALQFYQNNSKEIESALAAKATVEGEREVNSTMGRVGQSIDQMSTVERLAYEQAYSATGAKMGDIKKLGMTAEAQNSARSRIGKTLTEQVEMGPTTSISEYANRIAEKTREIGKTFRPMMTELDKAAARPSMRAIERQFDTDVRKVLGGGLYPEEQLGAAEDALARFKKVGGEDPSFTKLYDLRRDLDKKLETHFARVAGAPAPPGEAAVRQLRDIVQLEIMSSAERASAELGKPIAETLKLNNTIYKDLAAARSASRTAAARDAAAPAYTASDMMSVVAAMASGSPLGAAIPMANIIRKKFGNQIAAYAMRKAAGLENLATSSSRIDDLLDKGAKAVIEDKSGGRALKTFSQDEIREIRNAAQNPVAVQSRISDSIRSMSEYAPKVAFEVAAATARVASYLAIALPKDKPPMGPIFTTKNNDRHFSDTEMRKASAVIEVAADPSVVLDRMRQGLLSNDHVKALKAMHPQTFYKIQDFLMSHAAELRPEMSIQQQVTLSILFQKPIAKVMERSNINALQASFTGGDQAETPYSQARTKNMGKAAPISQMAGSVSQMAAGPIKGGGIRATTFDLAEKGGRK